MVENAVDFFDMVEQTEWHKSLQRTLIHWIGIHTSDRVLDVGCGAGHFVTQLAQRSEYAMGADASEDMVCRATLNLSDYHVENGAVVYGRGQSLPFDSDSFDIVTCVNLLFLFADPSSVTSELLRVCKPGGQVILLEPSSTFNPWTAQTYCVDNRLNDFERESFLSFATAAARYRRTRPTRIGDVWQAWGIVKTETISLMDGLTDIVRIVKPVGGGGKAEARTELTVHTAQS